MKSYLNEFTNELIIYFLWLSSLSSFLWIKRTRNWINKTGVNKRNYPDKYIMLKPWMKKLFCLKKQEIAQWCYHMLLVSLGNVGLFLICLILCVFLDNSEVLLDPFVYSWSALQAITLIYFDRHLKSYRRKGQKRK